MNNVEIDEIFNPQVKTTRIGDPRSQLWACGKNDNLELTIKGYKTVDLPSGVTLPKFVRIESVSSASNHSAFVTAKGHLYIWGSTLHGKLGIGTTNTVNVANPTLFPLSKTHRVVQVECGDYHTLCVFENGEVYGWGGTLHKKLGDKTSVPSLIDGLEKVKVAKVGCGDFHSVALSQNGILFSWGGGGSNFNKGQCGQGTTENIRSPKPIEFFKNKPVRDFACGGYHTVALCENRELYSWGSGNFGELGIGFYADSSVPKRIQIGRQVITQIACGGHHTVLLTSEGKILTCGNNNFGQTGHRAKQNIVVPTRVYNISNKVVRQVACGWNHTLAYVEPYYVYATGLSKHGELGQGDLEMRKGFHLIEGLSGKNVKRIFAGGYHSWFLMDAEHPDIDYQLASPLLNTPLGSIADDEYEPNKKRRVPDPKPPKEFDLENEEIVIGNDEDLARLDEEPSPPPEDEPTKQTATWRHGDPFSQTTQNFRDDRPHVRRPSDAPPEDNPNYTVSRAFTLAGKITHNEAFPKKFEEFGSNVTLGRDPDRPPEAPFNPNKLWYESNNTQTMDPEDPGDRGTDPNRRLFSEGGAFGIPGKKPDSRPPSRPHQHGTQGSDDLGRRSINESDRKSIHSDDDDRERTPRRRPEDQPKSKTFLKTRVEKDDQKKNRSIRDDHLGNDPEERAGRDRGKDRGRDWDEDDLGPSDRDRKRGARNEEGAHTSRSRNNPRDSDFDQDSYGRDRTGRRGPGNEYGAPAHDPGFYRTDGGPGFRTDWQIPDNKYQTGPTGSTGNSAGLPTPMWPGKGQPNYETDPNPSNYDFSRNPYGQSKKPLTQKLMRQRSNDVDMALFENDHPSDSEKQSERDRGAGKRRGKGKSELDLPGQSNPGSSHQGSRREDRSGRDSGRNGGEIKRRIEISESSSRQLDMTRLDFQLFFCDLKHSHRFAIVSFRAHVENSVNAKLQEALRYLHENDPKIHVLQVKRTSDLFIQQNGHLKLLIESFAPDKNLTTVVAMMVAAPETFERRRAREGFEPTDYSAFTRKKVSVGESIHLNARDVYSDERLAVLAKWYLVLRDMVGPVAEGVRFVELRPHFLR